METNKIYLGNAYELIKEIPDKSIDLIYTDPPYLYNSGFGGRLQESGKITSKQEKSISDISCGIDINFLNELVRVMKYIYIYMV